jgi:L-iditol 2-dehydrogenase
VRALRYHGTGDLRVEEVPDPVPGPGDVLVQVEVALTDGTDLKTFRRGHPLLLSEVPSPFGHEFCGIDVATGRRVVAANSAPCGECAACRRGQEPQCANLLPLLNGAYAELIVVPERIARVNLLPVPPGLAPEVAALVEPLACCLRGVERAEIQPGDTVAVLGAGPIGLMLCACVADAGGRPVLVGGRPERRALAPAFGAVSGDGCDADVAIEATGSEDAWRDALSLVRTGGTAVMFGGLPSGTEVAVDAYRVHYDELTVRGAFHHAPQHVRAALAFLASGARPWATLLTHEVSLEGLPGLFADPPRDYLKAVVRP